MTKQLIDFYCTIFIYGRVKLMNAALVITLHHQDRI